ncbi:hypothetical protein [Myxococcus eversor]|uniref:hypothetical protein n=1 Tax=Myxococcus eversor TaxID=2709661 RepID=UPI0013D48A8C|nr:hypothetical protein [Myxococcus eversor]
MKRITRSVALLSLLGAAACGAPEDANPNDLDTLASQEGELTGTEVTLPICDTGLTPSGWACWLDSGKQTACPAGQTPADYWWRYTSGSTYVRADAAQGIREVKTWSLSWGTSDFLYRAEAVHCNSVAPTYQASSWSRYTGSPTLQARVTSFVDHIRPAMVRGTVLASSDEFFCAGTGGCSTATSLVLVLKKRDLTQSTWTEARSLELPFNRNGAVTAYEVETTVEPGMDVALEVFVKTSFNAVTEVVFHDIRLFTEKCVPDMTNPGQCLP